MTVVGHVFTYWLLPVFSHLFPRCVWVGQFSH